MKRCPILVEREDELETLAALVAGSGPPVAVLTGEAGTGKSQLAQELVATLPDGWSAHTLRLTRTRGAGALPPRRPLLAVVDLAERQRLAAVGVGDRGAVGVRVRAGQDHVVYELGVHAGDRTGAAAPAVVTDVM